MHAHARPRVLAGYCWMKKCMGKKEVKLPVVDLVERKSIAVKSRTFLCERYGLYR